MLTLITGTPGAGKTLYAVWELARKVPGSTVESKGEAVPRRLLTNVKDLLVEHEHIDAEALKTWHQWAKPGDVILFDEVQEVWRPRALGKDVPPEIQALETHRHMGVDIILITQHPMLMDANVRRLVNLHLHVRRLAKKVARVYEWDHCAVQPGSVKTSLQSRTWFHPKQAYGLYKSAQLHTKPVTRFPRIALLLPLLLPAVGYAGWFVYDRVESRVKPPAAQSGKDTPGKPPVVDMAAVLVASEQAGGQRAGLPAATPAAPSATAPAPAVMGCISSVTNCRCWGPDGSVVELVAQACREASYRVGNLTALAGGTSALATPVPPSQDNAQASREAAAPGQLAVMPGAGYGLASRSGRSAP